MTYLDRPNLLDLSPQELGTLLADLGESRYRFGQIRKWLYRFGVSDFDAMTDLSRSLRARLAAKSRIGHLTHLGERISDDGTRKFLWGLDDGAKIESVLIRERDHQTLCLSSQVGCAMGCRFCRTARLGLTRNLTQSEIVGQFLAVRARLGTDDRLTNLVFMGMGEPLANIENLTRALALLTEPGLMGLSRRHLSVSTVGLVPNIPLLAQAITVGLTVSLNAADDHVRDRLMPVNHRWPMAELHRALSAFPLPRGRRITIAYVLLAGVNDREKDANNLTRFLHGLKVKINLIPFNPWPDAEFGRPDDVTVARFQDILLARDYTVIVRKSKGQDVDAACGQLAGQAQEGPRTGSPAT